jgi:hypothetical protein
VTQVLLFNHTCLINHPYTQAAPKRSSNESVLAIQPPQADQPTTAGKGLSEKATSKGGGLWSTLLIWGGVVLLVLVLAAVAPICHYSRLRPPNFTLSSSIPPVVQRLVGELPIIFFLFLI